MLLLAPAVCGRCDLDIKHALVLIENVAWIWLLREFDLGFFDVNAAFGAYNNAAIRGGVRTGFFDLDAKDAARAAGATLSMEVPPLGGPGEVTNVFAFGPLQVKLDVLPVLFRNVRHGWFFRIAEEQDKINL